LLKIRYGQAAKAVANIRFDKNKKKQVNRK